MAFNGLPCNERERRGGLGRLPLESDASPTVEHEGHQGTKATKAPTGTTGGRAAKRLADAGPQGRRRRADRRLVRKPRGNVRRLADGPPARAWPRRRRGRQPQSAAFVVFVDQPSARAA